MSNLSFSQQVRVMTRRTFVNGFEILNPETEFIPAMREALMSAVLKAQGVPFFVTEDLVRVKCMKADIIFMGQACPPAIPAWKPEAETHDQWKAKCAIALRAYSSKLTMYATGKLRQEIIETVNAVNVAFNGSNLSELAAPKPAEAPAEAPATSA